MNPKDYDQFVMKIWSEPDGHTERGVSIAGLGLIGECGEVCELLLGFRDEAYGPSGYLKSLGDDVADECGDVLYYLTVLANWRGLTFLDVHAKRGFMKMPYMSRHEAGLELVKRAKEVSERVKKWIRDGREFTEDEFVLYAGDLMSAVSLILEGVGRELQDAIDINVAKLEVRYAAVIAGEQGAHQARAANT